MRVLLTGHDGYIGRVLVPLLLEEGHEVTGVDSGLFDGCDFGQPTSRAPIRELKLDIRDLTADDLVGFDAIIHLAGISNDPLGDLAPEVTFDINYHGTIRLAQLAKKAGVCRFLYASSCSNYGSSDDKMLDETAHFNPVTPYAISKVRVEADLMPMADTRFSPIYLRAATAYGMSSRLRGDLVVNNLVGYAVTTGAVLIKSDGTPWRPLVHVQDIARAYVALLTAPRETVHNEAFNVGRSKENYRVREIADLVAAMVPGARVTFASGASPDVRNYRVSCDKIQRLVPSYRPTWRLAAGIEELYTAYVARGLTEQDFLDSRLFRVKQVTEQLAAGTLDMSLRRQKLAA